MSDHDYPHLSYLSDLPDADGGDEAQYWQGQEPSEYWDETEDSEASLSPARPHWTQRFRLGLGVLIALSLIGAAVLPGGFLHPSFDVGASGAFRAASNVGTSALQQPTATPVAPSMVSMADAYQQVMVNVFARAEPSVVNIEVVTSDVTEELDSSGSGFVYDTLGHIITNAHVVQDAVEVFVTFSDGYSVQGVVIGIDNFSDLAVVKVEVNPARLIPLSLGDSTNLKVGQAVIAIGNPFGLLSSMTTGVISATGRTLNSVRMLRPRTRQSFQNPSIIQIDAQINPGNSGGPLLNLYGEVIGVNTAIRSETGLFQGIGFAVPVNTIKRIIPQLINTGRAEYTWLGVTAVSSQSSGISGVSVAALAERLNLPISYGVMISEVLPDSPASRAGLLGGIQTVVIRGVDVIVGGDIIIAINGIPVRDFDQMIGYLVANTAPGDTITLTLYRGDQLLEVDVLLEARPAE
ncbi:MAG: trypsin-like peptidase domain-containing protein [Anaerolinea sp.]|nr:trypsin-like peptidase domain-containing protein [Anaerolinea sp.]MCC6972897.1 trypsin-like peptidase domain-containing protein [Anaerolineae bacterium]CAG0968565.1 putative serine protease PepD [Anaerolineae bacterium]